MHNALINRVFSGFPVSIGTGMALESLFTPVIDVYETEREVEKVNKDNYTIMIINVATLIRNILSSIPSDEVSYGTFQDYHAILKEEIDYLSELFSMENLPVCFYVHDYKYPKTRYADKIRTHSSIKQVEQNNITEYCLNKIAREDNIYKFNSHIVIKKELKALLLSHIPWDLLSADNFLSMHLLESHTGLVKTKKDWNSKYYAIPNKDMSLLPFTERLLTSLGDKVMFKPDPINKRLELYDLLASKKVNAMTSDEVLDILLTKYS